MKDITPIRLAKWLAAFNNQTIVGATHSPCNCPLANALKSINGSDYASVGGVTHTIGRAYGQYRHIDNKRWHKMFITRVDRLNHCIVQSPVNAGEAKSILVDITPPRYLTQVKRILGITD